MKYRKNSNRYHNDFRKMIVDLYMLPVKKLKIQAANIGICQYRCRI